MLDPRRHDLDAIGGCAVEVDELRSLGFAVCEDGIAACDDLGLSVGPALGLRVARLCLHAGERVEGADEREIEPVLELVAGHARQPVVRVDRVDVAVVEQPELDSLGEVIDDLGQRFFGQIDGSGFDMRNTEARLDVDGLGQIIGPLACVDGGFDTCLGQCAAEFTDIHVHAATITRPRLGEGRGVQAQDREFAHGRINTEICRAIPMSWIAATSGCLGVGLSVFGGLEPERLIDAHECPLLVFGQVRIAADLAGHVDVVAAVFEDPGPHIQRLGRDLESSGDLLEDVGRRLAQTTFDLAEVGIRDPGHLRQLPQRQVVDAALLADELTQVSPPVLDLVLHC